VAANPYIQRDQAPGVPPLTLTGERTLPDIPAENYWFRRHLAVYEWIATHVAGLRVLDMACGEGYGSAVLAAQASTVVGLEANSDAFEHARLRYCADNLSFARGMVETFGEPGAYETVVFLQTIEHVQDPVAVLAHLRGLITDAGTVYVSTPNVLRLAAPGAEKSDNPWHVREYRAAEFQRLCAAAFPSVELLGVFHARRLRAHELALRAGWDRLHRGLGISKLFYGRFTATISTRDFALRTGRLDRALDFVAICRTV
jgi:2-polyprenyl-3-methyl-5-hydroxy-6-metoxy-1,4-benzoquinol methylase